MSAPGVARPAVEPTTVALERAARDLAARHRQGTLAPGARGESSFADLPAMSVWLDTAHAHWTATHSKERGQANAAECFLENEDLVRGVLRRAERDLPTALEARLPRLSAGLNVGTPRVLVLARRFLNESDLDFDAPSLRAFLEAYQAVHPLTSLELRVIPTILKVEVVRALVGFLAELVPSAGPAVTGNRRLEIDPPPGVSRAVSLLVDLSDVDWTAFFERSSRLEAILAGDPARLYPRMDSDARETYRRVVEELACRTGHDERAVARLAVKLASEHDPAARAGHVGRYLVAEGRAGLEQRLGYTPPWRERVRRTIARNAAFVYLGSLFALTGGLLFLVAWCARASWTGGLALPLASLPALALATAFVQRLVPRLVRPRRLPRLDFSSGIPDDCRSVVVIPALLETPRDVRSLVRQLEAHYLANPDANIAFALLTDDVDVRPAAAADTSLPLPSSTSALIELAGRRIDALNVRYGAGGRGPFHLLHRESRYNPQEGCFMGWERKRGKLEEFNKLLRGDESTSFVRRFGDPRGLENIRFVITLDADTQLPPGSARRLVGLLTHPLNRAVIDEQGRVTAGYTLVQPRVETSPASSRRSRFSRLFAGDTTFDVYTHAVSDVYQDLFGAGAYVGKGIYEVDSFLRCVEGRAPENALVSHDHFEGMHGRTALASDIVLYEEYPPGYLAYARRKHRWIRGDWQLLPWLFPRVPLANGVRGPNLLTLIDRWKIVDNLRRTLLAPAVVILLGSSAFGGFGGLFTWVSAGALALLLLSVGSGERSKARFARGLLEVMLLPHEAAISVDAIGRALVRMLVTRRHLLQWTTAEATARAVAGQRRAAVWKEMAACPAMALILMAGTLLTREREETTAAGLAVALPLAAMWLLAPEVARWLSRVEEAPPPADDVEVEEEPARGTAPGETAAGLCPFVLGDARFSFDALKALARERASQPYVAPPRPAPEIVSQIDYAVHGTLTYRPDRALFADGPGQFPVTFFHLGAFFPKSVQMHAASGSAVRQIVYQHDSFDMPASSIARRMPPNAGFAGFRLHESRHGRPRPDRDGGPLDWRHNDWVAFLGASYFRAIGESYQYGLSARGLALDAGIDSVKEESPDFTHFYIETPAESGDSMTVYALLESPSVTGAYRFVMTRSAGVVMEVVCQLHVRRQVSRFGIAPLTSMYWFSETIKGASTDWRPEVHDSDGLAMWTGAGERLWRPLNNPPKTTTSSFEDEDPKGFGLMQRDRSFDHYLDGVAYERRPSLWVEPAGPWGRGAVQLVEIPTDDEFHDNIVAAWVPAEPIAAGRVVDLAYTLHWLDREPEHVAKQTRLARVVATHIGHGGEPGHRRPQGVKKFVVEFLGASLAALPAGTRAEAVVAASRGEIINAFTEALPNDVPGHWRAVFDLKVAAGDPVELRLFLRLRGEALTETWVYPFHTG